MAKHNPVTRPDALREMVRRLDRLERQVKRLNARAGWAAQVNRGKSDNMTPSEGMLVIEAEGSGLRYFSNGEWRGGALYAIKLFRDGQSVGVGDERFIFSVDHDVHYATLRSVRSYVTAVSSSGSPTVQVRNRTTGFDMLSVPLTIDQGERSSRTADVPAVINPSYARVSADDEIAIDIDVAGSGAQGMGVVLVFA